MKTVPILFLYIFTYTKCLLANTTVSPPLNVQRETKEMEFKDGLKIEEKYRLPLVNVSAKGVFNRTKTVTASLSRVLDFYNTELLSANWERVQYYVTPGCKNDVDQYIFGLQTMKNWALKMDDASGRYSNGWFWGNHYWAGSQTLCENIMPSSKSIFLFDYKRKYTRVRRNTQTSSKLSSPSQPFGYQAGDLLYTSVPPFHVSFYMLRVNLNTTFTSEEKIIHIGLCFPHICTDQDVKVILEQTSKASPRVSVSVEAVRSQHNKFSLWRNGTFIILCVVTSLVTFLLVTGTAYDFYLLNQKNKIKKLLAADCDNYSKQTDKFGRKKQIKLDMSMPDVKMKNGNCGFYMVNSNRSSCDGASSEPKTDFSSVTEDSFFLTIIKEVFLAFSVRINLKSICDQTVGIDTIPVVHGLKSISMLWVILGHTCIITFKYSDNMEYRKVVQKEFLFQTITNGAFSVDTFFFTSGLLVSFLYFRSSAKGKLDSLTNGSKGLTAGTLHFFGLILYRFARLTAPYLFVLGVVEVCMMWFNYNSIFEPPALDHINCPKYWWRNILYINTLFPVEEMCMLWSWYLSDDTQFYVVGAIMLILATSHFKSAACVLIIFLISSWMTTGYISYSNSHVPDPDDPLALFDKIYDKPWTRLGPYLIGMSVGWLLFKTDCCIKMSKLAVIVGWLTSIACFTSLIYGLYDVDLSPVAGAAYSSLSHSAWGMGLAWVVIACSTGYGGFANTVLSWTVLYPFSRVTYCAYLLHPIVIRFMTMCLDNPLHLGPMIMLIIFLGQIVISYSLAFVVSLAFEAPVISMLRILNKLAPTYRRKTSTTC